MLPLSLLAQLGPRLKSALDAGRRKIAELDALGALPAPGEVAEVILKSIADWSPLYNERPILDADDKRNLALGLAGVLIKIVRAEGAKAAKESETTS